MRTVVRRAFRDILRPPHLNEDELRPLWRDRSGIVPLFRDFYYRQHHYFHPITYCGLLFLLGAVLAAAGFRSAQVFVGALGITLLGLYLQTRALAEGLFLTRIVADRAFDRQEIEVEIEIRNASRFWISGLRVRDFTTASRNSENWVVPTVDLRPLSIRRERYGLRCDGGMGDHQFGPLTAQMSDRLGLFQFTVTESDPTPFQILPTYTPMGEFSVPASIESISLGLEDDNRSGPSTQFLGVRDYRSGDSLRRIHWRISARLRRLVVKEFETTVNSDVTLCLDMDPRNHIGLQSESTWERVKDVAIALLQDHLRSVNRIQLVSQGLWVPYGNGDEHRQALIRQISSLKPVSTADKLSILESMAGRVPFGSAVILVTPVYADNPERLLRARQISSRARGSYRAGGDRGPLFYGPPSRGRRSFPRWRWRTNRPSKRSRCCKRKRPGWECGCTSFVLIAR